MAFLHKYGETATWDTEHSCVVSTSRVHEHDDDDRRCNHCQSPSLVTDWAAGDRVCTNCGVVGEEHLVDDRPEWREFNDDNDRAKGLPSAARCGMVPVDETKYLGGLQPTTLSAHNFGGGGNSTLRKRLLHSNRKMDYMMEKQHKRSIQAAKLSRKVRQRQEHTTQQDDWEDVRPEYDQLVLQEEEDAQRAKEALYAEKWSLERAMLLHSNEEQSLQDDQQEDREDLLKRLDAPLQEASADLYRAYSILQEASRKLHLPHRVLHEATAMMCRYATRRDGIVVKGVSSRMSKTKCKDASMSDREASKRLRQYNKLKQAGSLAAALLFLTARKLGWQRSLAEVCSSFQLDQGTKKESFIKPKHCSRAMNEVKALFPHYGRATGPNVSRHESTGNFVDHTMRKLELPPVAIASIRTLVQHCRDEQVESGTQNETKLSTMCASIAFFVCLAGASLQRLAQQTQSADFDPVKLKRTPTGTESDGPSNKRIKLEGGRETGKEVGDEKSELMSRLFDEEAHPNQSVPDCESSTATTDTQADPKGASAFDVFSHSAVENYDSDKKRYEMRKIWDAWSEQTPWFRSIGRIEQSCGVSGNMVLMFYKSKIFPQRMALLGVLQENASTSDGANECRLKEIPLASVLLKNITAAAPLLNSKGKL